MVTDIPEHTEVNLHHLSGQVVSPPYIREKRNIGVRDHGKKKA